jgi:hypothetical protein
MFRLALLPLLLALPLQDPSEKERREYVEKNVAKAIEKGLQGLRMMQRPSGRFDWYGQAVHGSTGLALYTLIASGVDLTDVCASKALDWLLNNPYTWTKPRDYDTYEISLVAVALAYSIPLMADGAAKQRAVTMLQRAADWLMAAQAKGGGWWYSTKNDQHDHSNTQFAILGLRAAANAGARVKREVWDREVTHWKTAQLKDGSWAYRTCYKDQTGIGTGTSTMTAAGVMSLAMALGSRGAEVTPQTLAADASVKKGLAALKDHWDKGVRSDAAPPYYLLYSVERACMVTGVRLLGEVDWYNEGAYLLIREQDGAGLWSTGQNQVVNQCFALLFLKQAFIPVRTPSNKEGVEAKPGPAADDEGKPREME